ncbi:unnamed protein product [Pleuronectes platessa]|uniref:Uncharacterized protein n=1 Tax=Pleuronectes platessa TaxID=8262 RepID=A0A9N7YYP3_PLEPL|nr:unnamed protein product [Pleuronectes platessa]
MVTGGEKNSASGKAGRAAADHVATAARPAILKHAPAWLFRPVRLDPHFSVPHFDILGGPFRVQHLAQGHFGMQMGQIGDQTADLQVGGRPLYPSATAAHEIAMKFQCIDKRGLF